MSTDRERDVIAALRRLGPALDPDPEARDAAKHRLMLILTATPTEEDAAVAVLAG